MQDEQQSSGRITLSMPASRRAEFDAALLKLKQRRPFDSISKIVADAVIAAAVAIEAEPKETGELFSPMYAAA